MTFWQIRIKLNKKQYDDILHFLWLKINVNKEILIYNIIVEKSTN